MAEILTEYALKMDSKYFQEKTNILHDRTLPPYSERYHFINTLDKDIKKETSHESTAYVLKKDEAKRITEGYEVLYENSMYMVISLD